MVVLPAAAARIRATAGTPATPYRAPATRKPTEAAGKLAVAGYAVSQVIVLGLLWVAYGLARHLTDGQTAQAHANAVDVWAFERMVGLPGEDAVQRLVLGHGALVTSANWFYVGVHFPLALLFGVWVFARHRDAWVRVRNVVVLTTAAALVVHVLFPLAPPRFLPDAVPGLGLVDTGAVYGPSPYAEGSGLANQFAAMPSLHVGWALIEAWGVVTIARARGRWLALAQPILTFAVVVVTANHYWLDGVVAFLLVCGAIAVVARGLRPRVADDPATRADAPQNGPRLVPSQCGARDLCVAGDLGECE